MRPLHPTRTLAAIALGLAALAPAWAQEMLSISGSTVNLRKGPDTQAEVLWEVKKGYPMRVLERQARWAKVQDFEGDEGWVATSLTGKTPHHVVKSRVANVRTTPSTEGALVSKLDYGAVVQTLERQPDWVKVRLANGKTGWVANSLLWGW
jgi:SH3-like domain-containing protein